MTFERLIQFSKDEVDAGKDKILETDGYYCTRDSKNDQKIDTYSPNVSVYRTNSFVSK